MVGNIVDPIYAAKLECGEENPDSETDSKLAAIHDQHLGPYYKQWA